MGWGAELVARLADWMPVALATWTLTEVTLANANVTTGTLTKTGWLTGWLTGLGRRMERSGGRLTGSGSAAVAEAVLERRKRRGPGGRQRGLRGVGVGQRGAGAGAGSGVPRPARPPKWALACTGAQFW